MQRSYSDADTNRFCSYFFCNRQDWSVAQPSVYFQQKWFKLWDESCSVSFSTISGVPIFLRIPAAILTFGKYDVGMGFMLIPFIRNHGSYCRWERIIQAIFHALPWGRLRNHRYQHHPIYPKSYLYFLSKMMMLSWSAIILIKFAGISAILFSVRCVRSKKDFMVAGAKWPSDHSFSNIVNQVFELSYWPPKIYACHEKSAPSTFNVRWRVFVYNTNSSAKSPDNIIAISCLFLSDIPILTFINNVLRFDLKLRRCLNRDFPTSHPFSKV